MTMDAQPQGPPVPDMGGAVTFHPLDEEGLPLPQERVLAAEEPAPPVVDLAVPAYQGPGLQ